MVVLSASLRFLSPQPTGASFRRLGPVPRIPEAYRAHPLRYRENGVPLIPPILVRLGATVFNRVRPLIFAMPVFFAWMLLTVLSTPAVMLPKY
ncbi:hypothetical protein ASF56_23985 [Methylobacterium sp. Leaf122]|nr:hypothetical protein ASF56_23985 [Methylobacterium sp. Leaf122]